MLQSFIHYFLHLGFPFFIAYGFFRNDWKKVYLILLATMLVDLDHLVADPIFQANRCSINYHPLHTYYAMIGYFVLLFFSKPFNIIGIGLLFHMFTDLTDCMIMYARCRACLADSPAIGLLQGLFGILGI
jgi:hypothetical protein